MADVTLSPNMALPVPIPGVDSGPQYAIDLNSCLAILDQHNHTAGSGVAITPSAININSALTMNNQYLTNIGALTLFPQVSTPPLGSIYENGVDLYYIDGAGNVIRITQSGSVSGASGTITGLPSGTASASFGAGVFTFQAATNTPANLDGGSIVLRNNTASSFGLTLAPPNAMGANYGLVLPSIPAQTNVMTLDSSGNMGSATYDFVGQGMTSIGANAISNVQTISTSTTAGLGGVAISNSVSFATTSTTPVNITDLSAILTISGNKPVEVYLIPDGTNSTDPYGLEIVKSNSTAGGGVATILLLRDGSVIYRQIISMFSTLAATSAPFNTQMLIPSSSIKGLDLAGTAGAHTYSAQCYTDTGSTVFTLYRTKLVAREL